MEKDFNFYYELGPNFKNFRKSIKFIYDNGDKHIEDKLCNLLVSDINTLIDYFSDQYNKNKFNSVVACKNSMSVIILQTELKYRESQIINASIIINDVDINLYELNEMFASHMH